MNNKNEKIFSALSEMRRCDHRFLVSCPVFLAHSGHGFFDGQFVFLG